RAEEARRRLLADIAHELGTPLAVLQANVEGMLDGVVETSPDRLASLHAQIRVLTRLVRDLRDLSLAQQGQLPLDRRVTDLAALAREVVELSRPLAEDKGIALTVHAAGALPVVADRDRIAQVLQNLLSNALRYTEGGGVAVAVRRDATEGVVEVSDSGPGIPEEELPYVFERFYRVDRSRARTTGGAGLGLTIVKALVESHGGRVWARSRPGGGSTFGFALPLQPPGPVS
ncbi:MAG: HAMP domain-containing sensor histidine kinase, partial [Armatimonadota bacterium]|nr:HAMP domain-containing sensor histidine kinase [Armatimonadota bacterium]